MRVKICGVFEPAAALAAADAGADAVGFVFYPTHRLVTVEQARALSRLLPPFLTRVGVFADEPPGRVREVADAVPLDAVQLHGAEPPEACQILGVRVLKGLRIRGPEDLAALARYDVDGFVLDAYAPGQPGGTGVRFDWTLVRRARGLTERPLVLSGGLTAENVAEAIRVAAPDAVDVSSGVETDRRKDPAKIRAFIAAARAAFQDARA